MSHRLNKLFDDVDSIKSQLSDQNVKLERYNTLLDIHIKGVQNLDARVRPIEEHVNFIRNLAKTAVSLIALPAAMYYIAKLLQLIS